MFRGTCTHSIKNCGQNETKHNTHNDIMFEKKNDNYNSDSHVKN